MQRKLPIFFSIVVALVLVTPPVFAQSKFTNLEEEPAIRQKIEFRNDRFEIVPQSGITLNSGFRQHVTFGGRFRYHISDVFAFGVTGFFGTSFATGTFNNVIKSQNRDGVILPNGEADLANNADAAFDDFRRVREIKLGASLDGEFTPIYGKVSLFGRFFLRYDFSLILGVTGVQTAGIFDQIDPANQDPKDTRIVPGPHFGAGVRIFLNDFLAINAEFRDTLIIDNLDGLVDEDNNNDPIASLNNFATVNLGLSVFFPTLAKMSK